MVVALPIRRPLAGKFRTSVLKRRVRLHRWFAHLSGRDLSSIACRYLGADFVVDPRELVGYETAINRLEWRELAMMLAACREYRPRIFIDVGANIGLYSCIVGRSGAVGRVIAYEPDRRNFAQLAANIERNGLASVVRGRPCAAGARAGTSFLTPGSADNIGLSKLTAEGANSYTVDVVTLDDDIDVRGSTICIKIDVEDFEMEVLAGAKQLFSKNAGYAQIEALDDARAGEITQIMKGMSWRLVDRYGLNMQFERSPSEIAK